jgi:hypothetical protein
MSLIKQINICIARHYCTIIHNKLVGQTKSTHNGHIFYLNAVETYINQQRKSSTLLMDNVKHIAKLYKDTTGDIISIDMLIEDFVENYSFAPVYEKLTYLQKIEIYNSIIYKSLISYAEWLHSCDEKMFFGIELTDAQKTEFRNKLVELVKLNGAIIRFEVYNPDNETVPKRLFLELKSQYNKLKRKLDEQ